MVSGQLEQVGAGAGAIPNISFESIALRVRAKTEIYVTDPLDIVSRD